MKHFTITELSHSDTAVRLSIDNRPSLQAVTNLKALTDNVLDPAREHFGIPITVNSGYRCPRLNAAVGGSPTSQHISGEAADITFSDRHRNRQLFEYIRDHLPYDQLIWEKGTSDYPQWVHVSFSRKGNRHQVLHIK